MSRALLFAVLILTAGILTGCFSPPPPPVEPVLPPEPVLDEQPAPPPQPTFLDEMQALSAATLESGGLAAIGIAESKSLNLALNLAQKNGRMELTRQLTRRIESLTKAFAEETGTPADSPLLSKFNTTAEILIRHQIVGSTAQIMKYVVSDDSTITAYAFMDLSPRIIADQLAEEPELYERLQTTQAFQVLSREIEAYAALKAAQK